MSDLWNIQQNISIMIYYLKCIYAGLPHIKISTEFPLAIIISQSFYSIEMSGAVFHVRHQSLEWINFNDYTSYAISVQMPIGQTKQHLAIKYLAISSYNKYLKAKHSFFFYFINKPNWIYLLLRFFPCLEIKKSGFTRSWEHWIFIKLKVQNNQFP